MNRRRFLKNTAAIPLLPIAAAQALTNPVQGAATDSPARRVRPGDPAWPADEDWNKLRQAVEGRLIKVESPLAACGKGPDGAACQEVLKRLKNPYYIGDQPGLTQTSGWVDAWMSAPSVYAVAVATKEDVVAAVNFAREKNLRLVVKGGGHSYKGTSCSTDSLLIWTRAMNTIVLHFLHGYRSAWLPASLLKRESQGILTEALFATAQRWGVSLHFNKGLAGAGADDLAAARDTAMNPVVLDAFALAIVAGGGSPAFPGLPGPAPDLAEARRRAHAINAAMDELLKIEPNPGSYVSESNFFERSWQQSFWGPNYARLAAVKRKYDPVGLFFIHQGVGSEAWSADGFARLAGRQS